MFKNHFKPLIFATLIPSFGYAQGEIPPLPNLPSIESQAFDGLVQETMPLTPDQIREYRRLMDAREKAAAELPNFMPDQVTTSGIIDLRPGMSSPVVRVFPGYISNIVFQDEAGRPVLIKDLADPTQGGQQVFTVDWLKEGTSHALRISPNSTYARGNISVTLDGVDIPVSITVISGQRQVDDRVDLRVRGLNLMSTGTPMPESADSELMGLLSGVAPMGAVQLQTSVSGVEAYKWGNHLLLRASAQLNSPSAIAFRTSSDGTLAAKLELTSAVILSINGVRTMVSIKGL